VDMKLRIQRFTPAATKLLNLIPGDVGRPVGHLTSLLEGYDRLSEETAGVLDSLIPREVEVRTLGGVWYLLRIRPYRTLDNVIEGAVITFTDITEVKLAQETLRQAEGLRRRALVVEGALDPIIVQDGSGRILTWNPAAARVYGWSEAEAMEMPYVTLVPQELRGETRTMLDRVAGGGSVPPLTTRRCTRDGRTLPAWVTPTPLLTESGEIQISTTERVVQSLDAAGAGEGGEAS
jgi:two-component system, chemotaxis family, CheB/CheR fusion protein